MRSALRGALVVVTLAVPVLLAAPAQASDNTVSVPIGGGDCLIATTPTAQYNNGNPTMQPGQVVISNCAS